MSRGTLIIFIILLFSILPFIAYADIQCTGATCYQSVDVPLRIQEILIDAKLNLDESIDYTETIGLSYDFSKGNQSYNVLVPEFYLPEGSDIDPDIKITDLIDGDTLKRVYFLDTNCTDEFIFNEKENSLELCIEPQLQSRLTIEAKIFSDQNITSYEQFISKTDYIENPLTIPLPPNDYDYPFSMSIEGGNGVLIQNVSSETCSDPSGSRQDIKFIPTINGILCQGTIKPSGNKINKKILDVQALNQQKILEQQQQEMASLQLANINASIRASQAAVSATDASFFQLYLTITIAFFTGANIILAIMNINENRRSNKPRIKTKIDSIRDEKFALKIVNAGKSAATDADIEYTIEPGGGTYNWNHHLIEENEAIHFTPKQFKDTTLTEFLNKYDSIKINSKWKGPGGRIYREQYEIKLKDYQKSLETNLQLSEKEY